MAKLDFKGLSSAELAAHAHQCEAELNLDDAREAFDAALRLDPSSQSCAEGRARIAIQLREAGAADHCARALGAQTCPAGSKLSRLDAV